MLISVPIIQVGLFCCFAAIWKSRYTFVLGVTAFRITYYRLLWCCYGLSAGTPFLTGKNERNWTANFDFIVKPDNLQKILEGAYGSAAPEPKREHSYDLNRIMDHAMNTMPAIRR